MVRASTLFRFTARLAVMVPFAALLYGPSPGVAATAPSLGTADPFAVLGASTVTNTGATIVTGDLGLSPGSSITGFPPGIVNGTTHAADAAAALAQTDALAAYNALVVQVCDFGPFAPTDVLGVAPLQTLGPGVYCFSSSAQLTGNITLTGAGPWIFVIGSTLTTASSSSVVNGGSGPDTDIFWAVGSSATLGTGTAFAGNILAAASITLTTGANVSGRAIALVGAVTMDTNKVASRCSSGPCPHPLPAPFLLDHYQCYQAQPETNLQQHTVVLEDQFGQRTVRLQRPELICAPVVKNPDPENPFPDDLRNSVDHLVCYNEILNTRRKERREVSVENQFGQQNLVVKKPQLLCVPSHKTLR